MTSSAVHVTSTAHFQATVAYHQSQVMLANAMIISGQYKNEKIPKTDDPTKFMSEDEVFNTYIIRMKTHATALLKLRDPSAESSVQLLISNCTDQTLSSVYGEDVLNRVKDQYIQFEWVNLPIITKVEELNSAYCDIYGRSAPHVTIEMG